MLCLKAEALDDSDVHHHHTLSYSPTSDRSNSNSNGGFVLPLSWGSSIHRYFRKSGKISRRSLSSGDGSLTCSSDFEETRTRDRVYGGREGVESKSRYRYQLEQDVRKLQQQLQEEIDLRLALSSAIEHSDSQFSDSPCKLPDKAQELLDSLAVLEITVSKLEQESVSLQYQLSQERNERRLAEYHFRVSPPCKDSAAYLKTTDRETLEMGERRSQEDDVHPWQTVIAKPLLENLWHQPNRLSEEMVNCMRDIFLFLAKSSKNSSSESMPSPSLPQEHLSCLPSTSFLDSPILTSLGRSPSVDIDNVYEVFERYSSFDPYKVPGKVEWISSIGAYSTAVEVAWFSVGKSELEYATVSLKRYRMLVEQLAKVNPSCMSCNEKQAFWINIYNALIMHAHLAYGVPTSEIKFSSMMQKAAYSIGGLSFNLAAIECNCLKIQRPVHRPYIASVLASHKSKISEQQKQYSVDHPEPLLPFALSCGMHSSPAVRIFRHENVSELLRRSLKDYVRASIGISDKGKLLVPKLLHGFAKGTVVDESLLPAWICQFLSPEQASAVTDSLAKQKWWLLGARSYNIIAFDRRFRFLFLMEDEESDNP